MSILQQCRSQWSTGENPVGVDDTDLEPASIHVPEHFANQSLDVILHGAGPGMDPALAADRSIMSPNIMIAIAVLGTFPLNARTEERRPEAGLQRTDFVTKDGAGEDISHGGASGVSAREGTAAPSMPEDNQPQRLQNRRDGDEVIRKAITTRSVGGLVTHDDAKHPEVQFAAYLRERYSGAYAEVFSNHDFYPSKALFHGRAEILAVDPARTKIIGNFQMTYDDHPFNCDNYRSNARVFNKPHQQIENDPRVWDQAASLIDAALSNSGSIVQASSPSNPPLFHSLYGHQH